MHMYFRGILQCGLGVSKLYYTAVALYTIFQLDSPGTETSQNNKKEQELSQPWNECQAEHPQMSFDHVLTL